MKMKLIIAVILLAQCLPASAKTPPETTGDQYSTVYIYRPKALYGLLWNYKISVNGQKVKIRNNSSYELKVKPGETNFVIREVGGKKMKLNIEAGKDYYLQTYIRGGLFMGVPEIAEVTDRYGRDKLTEIKETRKHHATL